MAPPCGAVCTHSPPCRTGGAPASPCMSPVREWGAGGAMGRYGDLWGSMGFYGVLWGLYGYLSMGSLWVLYGVSMGSLWISMGPNGPLWVSMGSLWVCMGLYEVSLGLFGVSIHLYGSQCGSLGLYGDSVALYGSLWVSVGPKGSLWGLYGGSMGSLWVSMGLYEVSMGSYGVSMGPKGSQRVSMCLYVSLWVSMDLYGSLWVSMDLYGSLWVSMDLYVSLWVSMDLYGSLWVSMDLYGSLWVSMGSLCVPMGSLCVSMGCLWGLYVSLCVPMSHVSLSPDPPSHVTLLGPRVGAENESVTVTCSSAPSRPPARVRWWLRGRELSASQSSTEPAPGGGSVTSSNLTFIARRIDHGRPLVCEAVTAVGVARASLVLSITHPPDSLWVEAPPPNASFQVGALVRLGCHARGGHPPPRLVWSKEGRPLQEPLPGWGRDLELRMRPSDNGAAFTCSDSAHRQGAPRATAHIRVLFPPDSVSITAAPREPRVGQRLQLTCTTGSSNPPAQLSWEHRGQTLPGEPLPPSPAPHGGVTVGSRLRLQVALQDQGHVITCVASSPALGVAVRAGHRVSVRHPPLLRSPPGGVVVTRENSQVLLPVLGDAHPPLRDCTWSRGGARLAPSPRLRLLPGGSLSIGNVSRTDSGSYRVQCGNGEGTGSASLELHVEYPPSIVRAPEPVVVDEGGTIEMQCEADGSPLQDGSIRWQRLGSLPAGLEPLGGVPIGRLWAARARRDMGGAYECHVDTGVPPPARAIIRLLIRYPPELDPVPDPEPIPVLVPDGSDDVIIGCRARGVPPVEIQWEQGGSPISTMDSRFQQHHWSDPPWTSGLLTVANISQYRTRLRSQSRYWDQFEAQAPSQYRNWEGNGNGSLGILVCVARNPLGTVRRRFRLRLADRPDPPHSLRISGATPRSLRISWSPGFNGGSSQSFVLSARVPEAPPPSSYVITSDSSHTLTGLLPATPYDVTVRARNARGDSDAVVVRGVTSELPQDWPEEGAGPTAAPVGETPPPPLPVPSASGFPLPVFYIRFLTFGFSFPVSYFRFLHFLFPTSGFPHPVSHFLFPTSGFSVPVSHFRFPISGSHFRFPISPRGPHVAPRGLGLLPARRHLGRDPLVPPTSLPGGGTGSVPTA
uniref:Uncharacterized protein n=1 Tax=Melopsittacus undulatus TaxID=13146 RepID=A0A8V5GXS3_MELUD